MHHLKVKTIFNLISTKYDFLNDIFSLGLHRLWKKKLIYYLSPASGETWIDICCGTGDLTFELEKAIKPSGLVIGIDNATQILEVARLKNSAKNISNIDWLNVDVNKTNLPSNYFDGAIMSYGLRNIEDPLTGLIEIRRLLKPGASLGILDFRKFKKSSFGEKFQRLYLRMIVVPIAGLLGLKDEYAYIEKSIRRFPSEDELITLATKAGFSRSTFFNLAFGQMMILILIA